MQISMNERKIEQPNDKKKIQKKKNSSISGIIRTMFMYYYRLDVVIAKHFIYFIVN